MSRLAYMVIHRERGPMHFSDSTGLRCVDTMLPHQDGRVLAGRDCATLFISIGAARSAVANEARLGSHEEYVSALRIVRVNAEDLS